MNWRAQGFRAWLWQRVSAGYLALFLLGFLYAVMAGAPWDYNGWHDWIGQSRMGVLISLFFIALLVHSWVGIRDVLIDYVHPVAMRLTLLGIVAIVLGGMGIWALRIVFMASL